MPAFKPYKGYTRNLVLAFDVGTTYSGISYAILDPGEVPEICSVTRYPEQMNGDHKIPTILHYSDDGQVQSVGAEVHKAVTELRNEGQDPIVAEWFKLHLGPDNMKPDAGLESNYSNRSFVGGKTALDIFTDFLRYLFQWARQFITETYSESLWKSAEDRIEIILSHPNGWGGLQQSKLRDAAVHAGLVPDTTTGRQRVHFVSEGEASLHYCINNGIPPQALQDGKSVMVIDAGGGTVDINSYQFVTSSPVAVDEISPAMCVIQGSTRVNLQARKFFEAKFKGSKYGNKDDIDEMLERFEASAKRTFADDSERSYIKFGGRRDTDPKLGIRHGQMVLEGSDMAEFFKPSVDAIVDAVIKQHAASSAPVSLALLVGGYAASPWLFTKLKKGLAGIGLDIFRPNTHTNKAVADGAVSFYLKGIVSSRVAQRTYGVPCSRQFCPFFLDHIIRSARIFTRPCGQPAITGAFSAILTRGTRIHEAQELAIPLTRQSESPVTEIEADILGYRGTSDEPRWLDEEPEHFYRLCAIHADTTCVKNQRKFGPEGSFYEQAFKVILLCGLTEMKAQISWEEDGIEKRGPAKVIYDDDPVASAHE